MKKTLMGWVLAIPALFGLGLTSCQNENADLSADIQSGEKVYVTLEANLPEDLTRATFAPETETSNILKFEWEANDVISVVNSENGKWLGNLTVKEIKTDKTKCTFAGQIIDPGTTCTLKFYYLDSLSLPKEGADVQPLALDFSAQNGNKDQFGETDILIASQKYEGGVKGNIGYVNFNRDFAYGKYVLKYNGSELDLGNADVTISAESGNLYNVATLNLQKGEYTFTTKENNNNILLTSPGNNFYVKFFPTDEVVLKFTCVVTIDGKEEAFTGTKTTSNGKLVKNLYYTEQGSGLSMIVEMKHDDGRDDDQEFVLTYVPNYDGGTESKVATKKRVGSADFTVQSYDLFTRDGWTITSWNTAADGTGDKYEAGSTLTLTYPNTTATLYAQWEKSVYTWTVTWKNGYDENLVKQKEYTGKDGMSIAGEYPADPKRDGYTFAGWDKYVDKLSKSELDVVITAQWEVAKHNLEIWAYTNDGTDNHSIDKTLNKTLPYTAPLVNLDVPTRTDYTFMGWGMTPNATTAVEYVKFETPDPIKVYAIWKKKASSATITAPDSEGSDY